MSKKKKKMTDEEMKNEIDETVKEAMEATQTYDDEKANIDLDEIEAEQREEVKEEGSEFIELTEKYNNLENKYTRLLADYENTKRRNAQEVLDASTKGKVKVLEQLVDIIDNFDRAMEFDPTTKEFKQGMDMLNTMMKDRLASLGLEEVSTEGQLNPSIHQAIEVDNVEDMDDDVITKVFQKGYSVDGKVIRPAMVKVNKK